MKKFSSKKSARSSQKEDKKKSPSTLYKDQYKGQWKPKTSPGKSGRVLHYSAKKPSPIHRLFVNHKKTVFQGEERKHRHLDGKSLFSLDSRQYEPLSDDAVSLAHSMTDPLQVYRFRLAGYTTLNSVAGTVNTFLASDPSASGWNSPEWASLSSLFSEFRLVSLSVRIARPFVTGLTSAGVLAICSNLGTAVAPGSYAAVADNADSTLFNLTDSMQSSLSGVRGTGLCHTMRATDIGWSQVTTPTTEPFAGAPGSIQFYSAVTGGPSIEMYDVIIAGIYDFRVRV